jgi:uncharacterized protein
MKPRIASLTLAVALLIGVLGGKAVAQFGWLFPGFNPQQYPQQQYFPRAPGYAPRGSDEYQPRRSRSYAPPPRRSYVEPRRPRRSEAKARARLAPVAPKPEVAEVDPNTHIAVFGDRLADLVGEGLEEAYDEADDILVVRETHSDSGLADAAAQDWPKIIQEFLETDKKVAFAVVMLGANDRKPIREGEVSHPPLSEPWKEIYGQRIESVLRVFQERRLPVIWVGAPPMREERVSADLLALNDLVRDRVQRAGAIFVDIWPGFVDSENRYAVKGPDFEGRSPDYVRPEGRSRPLAVARRRTLLIWSSSSFSPPAKRRYPGHPATERSMYRSRRSTSRRGRERGPLLARYCRSRTRRRPAALSPPATPACRLTRW